MTMRTTKAKATNAYEMFAEVPSPLMLKKTKRARIATMKYMPVCTALDVWAEGLAFFDT